MKKVFTFNLWGNETTYLIGAIKNAQFIQSNFPDFESWFYIHELTVPGQIVKNLGNISNVKIILKTGDLNTSKPMMWRFEAIDDPEVEIMLSRDTDTRIWKREILAIKEWLDSNKLFHIMRDHPHHGNKINGGMFGTKKIPSIPSWKKLMKEFVQFGNRQYDQKFLEDYIYPYIVNDSIIHASFYKWETHAKDFPIDYDDELNFVGEYVYADEGRSHKHIQILKESLSKNKII